MPELTASMYTTTECSSSDVFSLFPVEPYSSLVLHSKHTLYVCARQQVKKESETWHGLQDLTMPGSHVDVNLHPTKQEVGFLHQDELLEAIREAVEELLLSSNDKSVLLTVMYTIMPGYGSHVLPLLTNDSMK